MSPCMPPSGVSFSRSVGSVVWPRTDTFPMRFHPLLRREECSEWKLDAHGRGNIVPLVCTVVEWRMGNFACWNVFNDMLLAPCSS